MKQRERLLPNTHAAVPQNNANNASTNMKNCCCVPCAASYLRMFHLACITVMATSFIVECILLNLIILPYMTEAKFHPTRCRYNVSFGNSPTRCENKCSKDRSHFPCKTVRVLYELPLTDNLIPSFQFGPTKITSQMSPQQPPLRSMSVQLNDTVKERKDVPSPLNQLAQYESHDKRIKGKVQNQKPRNNRIWRMGYLFDYHTTYNQYKWEKCATSPCYKREEDNVVWVEKFTERLHNLREFHCYFSVEQEYESNGEVHLHDHVLLYKLHSHSLVWNCLLWPNALMIMSVFSIIFIYATNRCHLWDTEKTVIA